MKFIAISFLLLSTAMCAQSTQESLPESLRSLEDPAQCTTAAKVILETGKANENTRKQINQLLPGLMAQHPQGVVWEREAFIAGELKVVGAIPILVGRLVEGDNQGLIVRASRSMRLQDDPAGLALVQMGELSLNAMAQSLKSSNVKERQKAALVLSNINTDASKRILCSHLSEETDPFVRQVIRGSC